MRGDACDGVHALPLNMCRPAGRRGAQRTDACWDGGQEEVYTSWRGLQTEVSVETASYQLLASVWWEGWKTEELQQKKNTLYPQGGLERHTASKSPQNVIDTKQQQLHLCIHYHTFHQQFGDRQSITLILSRKYIYVCLLVSMTVLLLFFKCA